MHMLFSVFQAGSYSYRVLGMRTRKNRLTRRKLDTGGKRRQTLGKIRKEGGVWKEPCEIYSGQNELRICENKNSVASRNGRLDSLL